MSTSPVIEIRRLDPSATKFIDFYFDFLLQNKPCLFTESLTSNWKSRNEWTRPNSSGDSKKPNFENMKLLFDGNSKIPITNCDKQTDYGNSDSIDMTLSEYFECISKGNKECLYLKDWHFQSEFKNYPAYNLPTFFQSDWLNEYWDYKKDSVEIDYRFVYIGTKGTWTPFHADVFRSFSWSANVCGRKLWHIVLPGFESNFNLNLHANQLAPDIRNYGCFNDPRVVSNLVQEAGETIFIPSYWHHQVHNLEDTISINHNWCNAANVNLVWRYLRDSLKNVQNEIIDVASSLDDWDDHCQKMLKADVGLNFEEFFIILIFIRRKRKEKMSSENINETKFLSFSKDERRIYFKNLCKCQNFTELCSSCDEFLTLYDNETSSTLINDMIKNEEFQKLACYTNCCQMVNE